jgi:hypothetical protein
MDGKEREYRDVRRRDRLRRQQKQQAGVPVHKKRVRATYNPGLNYKANLIRATPYPTSS